MELTVPKTIREVQRLTGMIAALGRFISKSAERCLPFFSAVKGLKAAPWTEECQTAFEGLKKYLSSPPLLTKPEPGEELFLYLSISSTALAAVLVREEHRQQKPIYYVNKVLHNAEARYQRVEKLPYALVMAARKLRPYFQAHTIKVLTDQPLRQVLHRPDISGRLVKWAMELSEFDIRYVPRPAIKAQVLADFVAECTIPQQLVDPEAVQLPVAERAAPEECIAEEIQTEIRPPSAEQDAITSTPTWECLRPNDAAYALQETHEGICGEHLGGKALAIKVLLRGLYWPTIRQDALDLVKRYELYHVLWAYRTTPRTTTGESPFNLSFGTEAVIPVDIGAPSPRITSFNEQLNSDGLRANLDLLEEIREESRIRVAAYKQRVSNYHNSKIRPREFRTGDLVLRKATVSQPTKVGKLSPTWEGPYRVKEVIRPGSYKLETLEEYLLPHAWNSGNLRRYYQ
ncbi:uncharacterized protein LOC143865077 [Tasmannia lanceolata]|uniref:uncharacterized protein LOC143865077 n=1 Tax=Tasmannia lanceolata TaxID=3420 RepID=UPI0040628C50